RGQGGVSGKQYGKTKIKGGKPYSPSPRRRGGRGGEVFVIFHLCSTTAPGYTAAVSPREPKRGAYHQPLRRHRRDRVHRSRSRRSTAPPGPAHGRRRRLVAGARPAGRRAPQPDARPRVAWATARRPPPHRPPPCHSP